MKAKTKLEMEATIKDLEIDRDTLWGIIENLTKNLNYLASENRRLINKLKEAKP